MGAYEYANLIERHLSSCEYLDPRPALPSKIEIPKANPFSIKWKEAFSFRDNKILKITDFAIFSKSGNVTERSFLYDFRDKGATYPIFRICSHGRCQSVFDACHVHFKHEDNIINLPSAQKIDFAYAIHCIKNFYLQKPQDWEEGKRHDTSF